MWLTVFIFHFVTHRYPISSAFFHGSSVFSFVTFYYFFWGGVLRYFSHEHNISVGSDCFIRAWYSEWFSYDIGIWIKDTATIFVLKTNLSFKGQYTTCVLQFYDQCTNFTIFLIILPSGMKIFWFNLIQCL